jgi:hypothetical protein
MTQASERYLELAGGPKSGLAQLFQVGEPPSVDALVGYEFRGFNQPWFMALLGIRKFIKAFFAADGVPFGCNTPVAGNALERDWVAKPDDANPKRFGFFGAGYTAPPPRSARGDALLLDYGRGHNRWYQPTRLLRDYLVRVEPGSDDLLLGRAYAAIGPFRIALSYFLLERHRPIAVEPSLPRR